MLDMKFVRENLDLVQAAMDKRGKEVPLGDFRQLDERRRELLYQVEQLKAKRNTVSKQVGEMKRSGQDATAIIEEMGRVGDAIKQMDEELKEIEPRMEDLLLRIPNIPNADVPQGKDDSDNVVMRTWGEPRQFDFEPKAHWDLGEGLDILDFERAGKVTGARFTFLKGAGARLERALINFMLDTHTTEHEYTEIFPPFMANSASMMGTGQLPKFAEDMFKIEGTDYFLIPTAEVPVTNLYRGEILDAEQLPIYHCAYSACFRAEAGSAGRDTRGVIRQHQFNKVELVKFVKPEVSYEELEKLTRNAEVILQKLGLPYRVSLLCSGDLTFSSAKTYDLEVWLPSFQGYREISSCSNFEDFQARRAGIRFRREKGAKTEFVHTLNGSGLAIGRTVAAILENYQDAEGNVVVPEALRPYMGGLEKIARK